MEEQKEHRTSSPRRYQSLNESPLEASHPYYHAEDARPSANNVLSALSQYPGLQDDNPSSYPSPADSKMDSSPLPSSKRSSPSSYNGIFRPLSLSEMPPPSQNLSRDDMVSTAVYIDRGHKRARLTPSVKAPDSVPRYPAIPQGNMAGRANVVSSVVQWPRWISSMRSYSPPVNSISLVPPSPASSSVGSDDSQQFKSRASSLPEQDRRMSIESLISGSSYTGSNSDAALRRHDSNNCDSFSKKSYYGVDPGYPDFDIPFNNDLQALNDSAPPLAAAPIPTASPRAANENKPCSQKETIDTVCGSRCRLSFYKTPIQVNIPKEFEPLPPILLALNDNNLLRLLLAYSASHRARLMGYIEPTTRIGHYVENMFSTLSGALANPHAQISNSTFATAIMLASLEIISPNPFGTKTTISWETHLSMTRKIIWERGIRERMVARHDEESYFLTRWFAYLDVLGSLSGGQKDPPMFRGDFWANDFDDDRQDHRIDCFFGFTTCCVCILAELAELAEICDRERAITPKGEFWQLSPTSLEAARKIRIDLMASMQQPYQGCQHGRRPSAQQDESTTHALELTTTNESYHWAGLIYLNRRVLGKPCFDDQIQDYVNFIVAGLGKLRQGGTAEACMLFPMFIAGCEALEEDCRRRFLGRLKSVEMTGMTQAHTARTLMQRVWEEGRPWEELINGEFIG
ncbi:MAG: hypothetical protein Q9217_006118 [Psora testacea]